jgi:cytochrome P450
MTSAAPTPLEEMLWVRSYDEAYAILVSPHFASELHRRISYPIVGESLVTLHGQEHQTRRRTEMALFTHEALRDYEFQAVLKTVREGLDGAVGGVPPGQLARVDLSRLMQTALLNVSVMLVGLDDVAFEHLRDIARALFEGTTSEFNTRNAQQAIESALAAKAEFARRYYYPSKARREALIARWRAGELSASDLPRDLLTVLLTKYAEWDDDRLLREVLFFLVASSNTTTHATPHVLFEVLKWLERNPHERDALRDKVFLQRVTGEGMRLHPPVPVLIRKALQDVEVGPSRLMIRAGDMVVIDLYSANQDREAFGADAVEFNPRRHTGRRHIYGVSFGFGPHACPGRTVALGGRTETSGADAGSSTPIGVIVRVLDELLRRGVRLDPDDPPQLRDDTAANRFSVFPVLLQT